MLYVRGVESDFDNNWPRCLFFFSVYFWVSRFFPFTMFDTTAGLILIRAQALEFYSRLAVLPDE